MYPAGLASGISSRQFPLKRYLFSRSPAGDRYIAADWWGTPRPLNVVIFAVPTLSQPPPSTRRCYQVSSTSNGMTGISIQELDIHELPQLELPSGK